MEALDKGRHLRTLGRIAESIRALESAIRSDPGNADAFDELGIALYLANKPHDALIRHQAALDLRAKSRVTASPQTSEACREHVMRVLEAAGRLGSDGDPDAAELLYRIAMLLDPASPQARNELGALRFRRGDAGGATTHFRAALAVAPQAGVVHNNLGHALASLGQLQEAAHHFHLALEADPNFGDAVNGLTSVLLRLADELASRGDLAGACDRLLAILEKDNEHTEAQYRLGNLRMRQGAWAEARKCHEKVLRVLPAHYGAMHNLGRVLQEQGDLEGAVACFQRAASFAPGTPDPHNNLGVCLQSMERHDEAIAAFEAALRIAPEHLESQNNLAVSLFRLGRSSEAVKYFRALVARVPGSAPAHSNLLMVLGTRPDIAPEALFREHEEFNRVHARPLESGARAHANLAQPGRRLRIGYVSPDFRLHPTMNFLEPLLVGHDRSSVELYAYFTSNQSDAVTAHVRPMFQRWLAVAQLGDEALANRIRDDGIDILVDLAGHGSSSRLLTFARKPAPIQVTWLTYCISTGLTAIDYRFSDRFFDPENEPLLSSEAVWRLPVYRVYKPLFKPGLEVSPLPAAANGHLTFGSFNNYSKVNDETVELWCDVLHDLRDARLVIVSNDGGAIARASVHSRFARHGIGPERIEVLGRMRMDAYHCLYHRIDVMLDPFPFPGATTTFDSLWMGVPPITLVTGSRVSRAGEGILDPLGLQEWIARDRSDYVAIARRAARDFGSLAKLRRTLRERLANSPLMDAAGFARSVESAYRAMWTAWCQHRDRDRDTMRVGEPD